MNGSGRIAESFGVASLHVLPFVDAQATLRRRMRQPAAASSPSDASDGSGITATISPVARMEAAKLPV